MRLGKHIAVIGGGVVGLAIALKLRREGYRRVILFEPGEPGGQTSSGSAALIMTTEVTPMSRPGLLWKVPSLLSDPRGPLAVSWKHAPGLAPWFRRFLKNGRRRNQMAIAEILAPMTTRSLDAWANMLGSYDSGKLLRKDGLLYVYKTSKAFRAGQKDAALAAEFDVESEILQPEELRQMEPSLSPDLAGGILYDENAHCVDPKKLATALSISFRTNGGEHQRTQVKKIRPAGSGMIHLACEDDEFTVDEVVVSAGAWSTSLVKSFGVKSSLACDRGYNLTLKEPGIDLRRPIFAGDDHFAITPIGDEGAIRLAGTSEFAGLSTPPNWDRSDMLLDQAKELLPDIDGEASATRWMGTRPSTPDSLPVIGRTPKNKNIICAFGHGHLGLTLGAVTAEIVADIIADRETDTPIDALSPSRFS